MNISKNKNVAQIDFACPGIAGGVRKEQSKYP